MIADRDVMRRQYRITRRTIRRIVDQVLKKYAKSLGEEERQNIQIIRQLIARGFEAKYIRTCDDLENIIVGLLGKISLASNCERVRKHDVMLLLIQSALSDETLIAIMKDFGVELSRAMLEKDIYNIELKVNGQTERIYVATIRRPISGLSLRTRGVYGAIVMRSGDYQSLLLDCIDTMIYAISRGGVLLIYPFYEPLLRVLQTLTKNSIEVIMKTFQRMSDTIKLFMLACLVARLRELEIIGYLRFVTTYIGYAFILLLTGGIDISIAKEKLMDLLATLCGISIRKSRELIHGILSRLLRDRFLMIRNNLPTINVSPWDLLDIIMSELQLRL